MELCFGLWVRKSRLCFCTVHWCSVTVCIFKLLLVCSSFGELWISEPKFGLSCMMFAVVLNTVVSCYLSGAFDLLLAHVFWLLTGVWLDFLCYETCVFLERSSNFLMSRVLHNWCVCLLFINWMYSSGWSCAWLHAAPFDQSDCVAVISPSTLSTRLPRKLHKILSASTHLTMLCGLMPSPLTVAHPMTSCQRRCCCGVNMWCCSVGVFGAVRVVPHCWKWVHARH